ncbi:MAG TPA: hypothetical protein DCS93_01490 [Microscillaceae bacterium]|nr:hypothetical protein [Microscillaceae bacterium]
MKYILYFLLSIFIITNALGQSKTLLVKRRNISLIAEKVRIDWNFDERKGQWVITKDSLVKQRELSGKKIEWQAIEPLPKWLDREFRIETSIYRFTQNGYVFIKDRDWGLYRYYPLNIKGKTIWVILDGYHQISQIIVKTLKKGFYFSLEKKYLSSRSPDFSQLIKFEDIRIHHEEIGYSQQGGGLCSQYGKLGFQYQGKVVIPTRYDSIKIYDKIARAYQGQNLVFYNLEGKKLGENPRTYYLYSGKYLQVIDSSNQMYFLSYKGERLKSPKEKRSFWGNDTDGSWYTYKLSKNRLETFFRSAGEQGVCGYYINDWELLYHYYRKQKALSTYRKMLEKYLKKRKNKQAYCLLYYLSIDTRYDKELKKLMFGEKNPLKDNIQRSYYDRKKLNKRYKQKRFINGKTSFAYEEYWYYVGFYEKLPHNYMMAKKGRKYGVFNFENNEVILPFQYTKITSYSYYLLIQKGKLKGYYPYTGKEPKYIVLEPFQVHYARFQDAQGKTGWVDRDGREFFD